MTSLPPDVDTDLREENTRLRRELRAARDRQAASAEILRTIAGAPGDAERSLRQIAEITERLFGASSVTVLIADGERWGRTIRVGAGSERIAAAIPLAHVAITLQFMPGAVYLENRQVHVADADDPTAMARWPGLAPARAAGTRTVAGTPLRRAGQAVGVLIVHRDRPEPFTDEELALQQNFADQAAIAIENARLFNEASQALERQTATADILKVIASSPSDVQPVFEAIATSAKGLIGGFSATVTRFVGDTLHLVAFTPTNARADEALQASFPIPLAKFPPFELVRGGETVQFTDTEAEGVPATNREMARLRGYRSMVFTPLMSSGTPIGMISITRKEPGSLAAHHVQLLQTFADQAVIAIENVRLFNETREALERQTATADILKVIASSPSDVQPVFDAIATSAKRLIGGFSAAVTRFVGDEFHLVAFTPTNPTADEALQASFPMPRAEWSPFDLVRGGETVQFTDTDSQGVPPVNREMARLRGTRSMVFTPLMSNGIPIGMISVTRKEPGSFTAHYIQLLQTFADQAVIAIENTRLFKETQEALERQTATADILKVIASSPSDVQPVFEAIAERSNRLVEGFSTGVYSLVDDTLYLKAFTRINPEADAALQASFPRPLSELSFGEHIRDGEIVQIPDIEAAVEMSMPALQDMARLRGFRGVLFVPLLRDRATIGLISVTRKEPGAFAAHHIQLLQTFADQAVIAIENVRLFDEVQAKTGDLTEALQQQTATSDVLKVISRSAFDLQAVLTTLVRSALDLCNAPIGSFFLREGDVLRLVTQVGCPPGLVQYFHDNPIPLNQSSGAGRAFSTGRVAHFPDVLADPDYRLSEAQRLGGFRSLLAVPLLREQEAIGVFSLSRTRPEPFSQRQIDLVTTFADQAVIAIENVRLFDEVQARTDDLRESLEFQTASSDVLKVISSSPDSLQPVLDVIVETSRQLCGTETSTIFLLHDNKFHIAAASGAMPEYLDFLKNNPIALDQRGSSTSRAAREKRTVHIPDIGADPEFGQGPMAVGQRRALLSVPLMREGAAIGVITMRQSHLTPFTNRQIEVVQTFADQAVIAISNVRLFEQVQAKTRDLTEALAHQTGSANILKVIASSPTDVEPVLKAIVENACELCEAYDAIVCLKDGDDLRFSAHQGPIPIGLEKWPINRNWTAGRAFMDQRAVHVHDLLESADFPDGRELARRMGHRSILSVPLLRENESVGAILLRRTEVHPFSEKQIALLRTFADQAVIAIGNVRLFDEVQARTEDLRESLEFQTASSDVLKVISRSPDSLQPVLDVIVETSRQLCGSDASTIFLLRDRKFHVAAVSGPLPKHLEFLRANPVAIDQPGSALARAAHERRTLHYPNIADDPELRQGLTGLGGPRALLTVPLMRDDQVIGAISLRRSYLTPFTTRQIEAVETFADQAVIAIENVRLFDEVQARTQELTQSLDDLRTAQDRLIQTEKLASLGQLTAGIAHEIKNPLNFVNNFAALSAELTDELNDTLKPVPLAGTTREEVDELTRMLKDNLEKVVQHGKRADSIVKNMLLHSREGTGEHRPADINALLDESLNLAYHGARAEKPHFNVTLRRDFDAKAGTIEVFPQEITRVFLNLISNGFYAVTKRKIEVGNSAFEPTLSATTRNLDHAVEIRIRDNGTGIPAAVKEKMFNPFYTTKPAGEGTGLGLSMSHDIVVKQHGGTIEVDTEVGQYTEFRIVLPRASHQSNQKRGQT
jgi:GAF domain-containing protein